MFAGLGAARIRKLFEQARNDAPAIIFIDELDAVGTKRMGGGLHREHDQTLNQLLVELDGFNSGAGQVIVMGASNRLQDLDPALLRPGRFDRQILVSPPDLAGREEILGVHTRGKPLAPDVDLHVVARQTAGLTGADLANVANEAAIFAGRESRQNISQANFEGAMERVVAGLQQRRVVTEKEKRILAYHEAGHAVMAYLLGDPVQKATIVARGDALGYTFHLPDEDRYLHTREELIDWMKIALAGRAAERVVFGRVTNGAANDLEKVTSLARAMVFEYGMSEEVVSRTMRADNYALSEETKRLRDKEQALLTDGAYEEAIRLLEKHRSALDRVAGALLDRETLNRDDLESLLADLEPESALQRSASARSVPFRSLTKPDSASGRERPADPPRRDGGRRPRRGRRDLRALFGARVEHRATVEDQGVEAASLTARRGARRADGSLGADTPVGRFLAKRGPGMHHVAYEVGDLPAALRHLSDHGAELIDEAPAPGLFGLQVAFVHPGRRSRRTLGVGRRWHQRTDTRIEVGFEGSQIMSALVTARRPRTLETALSNGTAERSPLDAEDGRYTVALEPGRLPQALRARGASRLRRN